MNLVTFGFSEKGCPVFLNEAPYPQVGTMYLMKAGDNSTIGITIDEKLLKGVKAPKAAKAVKAPKTAKAKAARKPRVAKAAKSDAPKKRGRKPRVAKAEVQVPEEA